MIEEQEIEFSEITEESRRRFQWNYPGQFELYKAMNTGDWETILRMKGWSYTSKYLLFSSWDFVTGLKKFVLFSFSNFLRKVSTLAFMASQTVEKRKSYIKEEEELDKENSNSHNSH